MVSVARIGEVEALMDTGAGISMVRNDVLPEFLWEHVQQYRGTPLRDAGSRPLVPMGTICLTIRQEGRAIDLPNIAVVETCPYEMLLGSDYLERVGGFINCRTGRLIPETTSVEADEDVDKKGVCEDSFGQKGERILEVMPSIKEEVEGEVVVESEESQSFGEMEGACCVVEGGSVGHFQCEETRFTVRPTVAIGVRENSTSFIELETGLGEGLTVMVEANCRLRHNQEWITPSAVLTTHGMTGVVRIPVSNPFPTAKVLKPSVKFRAFVVSGKVEGRVEKDSPQLVVGAVAEAPVVPPVRVGENLSVMQREKVLDLLARHNSVFAQGQLPVAPFSGNLFVHTIDTGANRPTSVCPRRRAPAERLAIQEEVGKMLEMGVIERASGPWSSPIVLVEKKDGSLRFCVDYRRLNDATVKDVYPLPRIDDVLDRLGGAKFFTTLDLFKGYWQIPLHLRDRVKTAFVTPDGLFQFRVMPFGLCNAPASFQRMMDAVLGPLKWQTCLVYMDDILIFADTFEEHLDRIATVLEAIEAAGLLLQAPKCLFASSQTKYLGHIIDASGVLPDPDKVQALQQFPTPTCVKEVRRFLGVASFYRRFIEGFARLSDPLTALLKKGRVWSWGEEEERAFRDLIERLSTAPVLAHLDDAADLILHTDASLTGLGAVLSQGARTDERVVS